LSIETTNTDTTAPSTATSSAPADESLIGAEDSDFTQEAIRAALAEEKGETPKEQTDSTTTTTTTEKTRPEFVPEKFWDAEKGEARWEDLAKSYAELEKKQSKPEGTTEEGKKPATDAEANAKATDFSSYTEEFAKSGDLSAESRGKIAEALKAAGIDNAAEMVEQFVEGSKARVEIQKATAAAELFEITEGPANYQDMAKWAMEHLPEAERKEFDEDVTSGNMRLAKRAVKALHSRWMAEREELPEVVGGKGGQGGSTGYDTYDEMVSDMSDPRYEKDPAFRAKVDRKIERTVA
jgi:hypothetical protein